MTASRLITNVGATGLSRRRFLALSSMLAGTGVLTVACSANKTVSAEDIAGDIRFSWWGNAHRQEIYATFAEGFSEVQPEVTVKVEPSEYSPYLDRLAVQASGKNLPDVFWIPANQTSSFGTSGVLLDLTDMPEDVLSFKDMPAELVESWKVDGKQVAPAYSQYSPYLQLDKTAFDKAGVSVDFDDESWTWDDFWNLAEAYSKAAGEGNWGISLGASFYQHAHLFIRQNGGEVFDDKGELVLDPKILGDWYRMWQQGLDRGAVMPPQISGTDVQWTQTGHKTALYLVQGNQFLDNATFSEGRDLQLFHQPTNPDGTDDYQFHYQIRIVAAANTKNPAAAASFINYFLNHESAAELVGLASGVPTNQKIVEVIKANADENQIKMLDMQARIDAMPKRPRTEPPPAGAGWQQLIETASDNIFGGGQDIDAAVTAGIDELKRTLEQGA